MAPGTSNVLWRLEMPNRVNGSASCINSYCIKGMAAAKGRLLYCAHWARGLTDAHLCAYAA
jgi:hypothetical protein